LHYFLVLFLGVSNLVGLHILVWWGGWEMEMNECNSSFLCLVVRLEEEKLKVRRKNHGLHLTILPILKTFRNEKS
jgi:hypothetical protein